MKVWATTDKHASVMLFLWMSKTNWGFLITFTQNLSGRLYRGRHRWVRSTQTGTRTDQKTFDCLYLLNEDDAKEPPNPRSPSSHRNSPVALPGVPYIRVCYEVFIRLLIQKVKHVLDGEGQGAASVRCAKDCLKQVVHKLLERALKTRTSTVHPNSSCLFLLVKQHQRPLMMKQFVLERTIHLWAFRPVFSNLCLTEHRAACTFTLEQISFLNTQSWGGNEKKIFLLLSSSGSNVNHIPN